MMARQTTKAILFIFSIIIGSCVHEPFAIQEETGYPEGVREIMVNKCAVSGCHNNASYVAASGLNLSTWDALFKGARSGAAVIPFSPHFSPLCYFTNTDTTLGVSIQPTMPVGQAPLSKEEYQTLVNWIAAGAPNSKGEIKFADNANRKKYYITNRICEVITVVDAESLLPMRYLSTINSSGGKFPYRVMASPDRKNFYVSFFAPGNTIQKYDAENDSYISDIHLGHGTWTSFALTPDSRCGFFVDNASPGRIAYTDLQTGQVLANYTYNFHYPLGIGINGQLQKLYVGTGFGNFIYSIDIADPSHPVITEVPIDGSSTVSHAPLLDPSELLVEANTCYVACAGSREIRVIDMSTDALVATIPLGNIPAFMARSATTNKLFVTCPDDLTSFPGNRGSVAVIDLNTNTLIKKINTGYQPYGIAVDEEHNVVAVVNANVSSDSPGSHHPTKCGEKNGNISFIDLNTLILRPEKRELSVFAFGLGMR